MCGVVCRGVVCVSGDLWGEGDWCVCEGGGVVCVSVVWWSDVRGVVCICVSME